MQSFQVDQSVLLQRAITFLRRCTSGYDLYRAPTAQRLHRTYSMDSTQKLKSSFSWLPNPRLTGKNMWCHLWFTSHNRRQGPPPKKLPDCETISPHLK